MPGACTLARSLDAVRLILSDATVSETIMGFSDASVQAAVPINGRAVDDAWRYRSEWISDFAGLVIVMAEEPLTAACASAVRGNFLV